MPFLRLPIVVHFQMHQKIGKMRSHEGARRRWTKVWLLSANLHAKIDMGWNSRFGVFLCSYTGNETSETNNSLSFLSLIFPLKIMFQVTEDVRRRLVNVLVILNLQSFVIGKRASIPPKSSNCAHTVFVGKALKTRPIPLTTIDQLCRLSARWKSSCSCIYLNEERLVTVTPTHRSSYVRAVGNFHPKINNLSLQVATETVSFKL